MYSLMFKIAFVLLLLPSATVFAQEDESARKPSIVIPEEASEAAAVAKSGDEKGSDEEEDEEKELPPVETLTGDPQIEEMVRRIQLYEPHVLLEQIGSMFFTSYEQNLIKDAREGLTARLPSQAEIEKSIKEQKEGKRPPMGPRELSLGGIVYVSSGDWTVWLNGQKITPDRLPPEILDISVYKDFVKIKWFDAYTNQIFPIKIKTHQRFNIDTRIFLPG